jgi:hypothetical protein
MFSRLTVGVAALAGLLFSGGVGNASEAGILTLGGPFNVANTGQCWDLGSNAPGAQVGMFTCHYEDTYTSQKWHAVGSQRSTTSSTATGCAWTTRPMSAARSSWRRATTRTTSSASSGTRSVRSDDLVHDRRFLIDAR